MTDYKLVPKSIVDELAQFIRKVDGNNRMGAGALAEKICERFRVDAPAVQREPVSAQVRYRRPEKGQPDWSVWQPAAVRLDRPSWEIDSQGWEVEYRLLYTAPQSAEPDEERLALEAVMESIDPATWPGLTPAQRCALGRFAKPQPAEQQPASDVDVRMRLSDYVALQAAYEEELFCVRQDRDTHFGELVRALEQVDAMKAECEKLRAAMVEAKSYIEHYMYGGSSYREPAAKAIAIIDAAMEGATSEGS